MFQRVNLEVIDGAGERRMGRGELGSTVPGALTVEGGMVLTPEMLQRMLPEVAIVVKGAIQSAGAIQTQQPSNPQLPSKINQDQEKASAQKPLQIHKPKQEKVKQPNLESRQRWNMFPCNLCTLRFPSRLTLNEHRLNHEPFRSLGIAHRKYRTMRDESRAEKEPYMCKYCPRIFATKERRQLHMTSHLKSKTYRETNRIDNKKNSVLFCCNNCEKYFPSKFELYAHKKRTACCLVDILYQRKYSCQICSEGFEDSFRLTLHMRTHGAPLKSYARKPKSSSVNAAKPHKDTELSGSFSAQEPRPAKSVNAKPLKGRELGECFSVRNPMPADSVNATNGHKETELAGIYLARNQNPTDLVNVTKVHKDTEIGDSDLARNPKPAGVVNEALTNPHKDRELGGSYLAANPKLAASVNAPKAKKYFGDSRTAQNPMHRDIELGGSYSVGNPKPADSIKAITHKKQLEDSFLSCNRINRITKTYTRSKIPKLTNVADYPTANNQTVMAKKVPGKEDFRDSLNERINLEAAVQPLHICEVKSQDCTSETAKAESNKNILPLRYNCQDNMYAVLNSIAAKAEVREKYDKNLNTNANVGSYKNKERIVLRPELLKQLEIDLTGEVSAMDMDNNIEYDVPNAQVLNKKFAKDKYYHDGINYEVNKHNTTVIKAKEPEAVFGEKNIKYGNDVWSGAVIKNESRELELDKESMMKTELLSLCKHEIKDEVVIKESYKERGEHYAMSPKVNKQDTAVAIAEEPEDFGDKGSENGNDSIDIVKEEPQDSQVPEFDEDTLTKIKLLSLFKHEVKDEFMLGSLLQNPQVTCEVQNKKDVAYSVNEQNIETVIIKEEPVELTENLNAGPNDGVNAALEAAWRELYAEHEAIGLALVKIQKDPEITDTVDLTTDIKNKQGTVSVKEELEGIEDPKRTDVVDLTAHIKNKQDTASVKEELEGIEDPKRTDVVDLTAHIKNKQGTVSVKEELEGIEDPKRTDVVDLTAHIKNKQGTVSVKEELEGIEDPKKTDVVDLTAHINNKQDTVCIKEELEGIEDPKRTDVVDLTALIKNKQDTVSVKEELEVIEDPKRTDVVDLTAHIKNKQDTVSVKEELEGIEDPKLVDAVDLTAHVKIKNK